jgi:glycosyltransferase involved in cell wall biosynthesis
MESPSIKKVLFVITKSNWGGAQKYVYDLATSLPRERFEVKVVCGGEGELFHRLKENGVAIIPIKSLKRDIGVFADMRSLFEIAQICRNERPDVVHVNSSKAGGLGAVAARIARVRQIVFTCHGWAFNEERPPFVLAIIKFFSWLTVVFSHVTIAVSERDFNDGARLLWVKRKIRLVHNGIREPKFKKRDDARALISGIARDLGVNICPSDFVIGANGELHKNKGYQYMIEAFSLLKKESPRPIKLFIISDGEEKESIQEQISNFGLEKDVVLGGFIKDAPIYLSAFDGFVLSSIKEGLPYVVIEAGFAGLPVVATNVGGVKEILEDMKSGILVQTRKPNDIAQALLFIIKNPDRASLFGKTLKDRSKVEFSLEKMVRETALVYES